MKMHQQMAQHGTAREGFAAAVPLEIRFSKQNECLREETA
jgi:hypothetical protein